MKTLPILILLLSFSIGLQANEQKVKSKINSVTVFRNGAQVYRKVWLNLKKGRTEVVFSKLARSINANSIQVSGKGKFTILSVYHRLNYLDRLKVNRRIKNLRDSINDIKKDIQYIDNDISILNEEARMIKANIRIGGTQNGVKVSELQAASEFFRKRIGEIYTAILNHRFAKTEKQKLQSKLQKQLNTLSRSNVDAVSEIVVEVISQNTVKGSMSVNYLVNNARWNPEYDIRATKINEPIELHTRALIYQNTGVDWNNVKLTVSTGNPNRSGVIPSLYTWYLQYRDIRTKTRSLKKAKGYTQTYDMELDVDDVKIASESRSDKKIVYSNFNASNSSNYTTAVNAQTNMKYEISIPYNIPSSNKVSRVKVQKKLLDASYRYYCVPKLDQDVFLQARITGWEDLNLVSGNINVFFEGTYVSKSYLNANNFFDTLDISLGRDKSIVVKREKIKDKSRNTFIGSNKKTVRAWNISIRNTKSEAIKLIIEDQIPLSRSKDVQVELLKKSGAKLNAIDGKLNWDLELKGRTTKEIDFSYEITYPKNFYLTNME